MHLLRSVIVLSSACVQTKLFVSPRIVLQFEQKTTKGLSGASRLTTLLDTPTPPLASPSAFPFTPVFLLPPCSSPASLPRFMMEAKRLSVTSSNEAPMGQTRYQSKDLEMYLPLHDALPRSSPVLVAEFLANCVPPLHFPR